MELANDTMAKSSGHVVYIDEDKRHMYDLKHDLRFISMNEFPIKTSEEFIGFICGIISNDYDIEHIFIDGLCKVMTCEIEHLPAFIARLEDIGKRYDISFVASVSCEDLPAELESYRM